MHGVDYGGFAYGLWTVVLFSILITLFLIFSLIFMWPILMILYHRLSKREEKILHEKFGKKFERYKAKVPAYFPRLRKKDGYE